MSSQVVGEGIYAGLFYQVVNKDGKLYVGLDGETVALMMNQGANLKLLDDIGDQDPDDVMATLFDSIPKDKTDQKSE